MFSCSVLQGAAAADLDSSSDTLIEPDEVTRSSDLRVSYTPSLVLESEKSESDTASTTPTKQKVTTPLHVLSRFVLYYGIRR